MFDQLKPIMQNGERYIVVESGRPEYVVMRFPDYVGLIARMDGSPSYRPRMPETRSAEWAAVNAELEEARATTADLRPEFAAAPETMAGAMDPTTIRLEDLPL